MSNRLKALLIKHEGLKLRAYKCPAGKTTIGVGRNLEDVGISEHEALILLETDIARCRLAAEDTLPFYLDLTEARQDVIVSMIFNIGLSGFLKFKRLLAALEDGDYELAAQEMLKSKWATQVGKRAHELASMMRRGEY